MSLTKEERDSLVARARELDAIPYPGADATRDALHSYNLSQEQYYTVLAEYHDRLPRVLMSVCPFTGRPIKRSIDPYGLDGFWWHTTPICEIQEPAAPDTFKLLMGALDLRGREPKEAREGVLPGPPVPFVIPKVLDLPEMVVVIGRLELETGDVAYPIAYFSTAEIEPILLYQPWCRDINWYKTPSGGDAWTIANDPWDFELTPHVTAGRVRWVDLSQKKPKVEDGRDGKPCPFVDLPGERAPQSVCGGELELLAVPDGTPINPFDT